MTDQEANAFVDAQTWHFAKTMPKWPHWYCLRAETPDIAAFNAFVRHIEEAGYRAEFRPANSAAWAVRWYLDIGLHHYWTMDATVNQTMLINRAKHPNIAVRLQRPVAHRGPN
jgi:hypothetical protein